MILLFKYFLTFHRCAVLLYLYRIMWYDMNIERYPTAAAARCFFVHQYSALSSSRTTIIQMYVVHDRRQVCLRCSRKMAERCPNSSLRWYDTAAVLVCCDQQMYTAWYPRVLRYILLVQHRIMVVRHILHDQKCHSFSQAII